MTMRHAESGSRPAPFTLLAAALLAGHVGAAAALVQPDPPPAGDDDAEARFRQETGYDGPYVVIQEDAAPRPPFDFSDEDRALLDEIQQATFRWFWDSPDVGPLGTIKDRSSGDHVSIAGVGYQFAAIVIGVERGWITRSQGERRAKAILENMLRSDRNRKEGLFFHFLEDATLDVKINWDVVSTIDSAILFAGALTASAYFGGEVAELADGMVAAANWPWFQAPADDPDAWQRGLVSLGWKPDDWVNDPTGDGSFLDTVWIDSSDEERLIYFIAAGQPDPELRLPPELYYRTWRNMGDWRGLGPMTQTGGPLFRCFFAHLWIDYASIHEANGPDRPDLFGFDHRPPVDWWENARRNTRVHRGKAVLENPGFDTVHENSWGMSACDAPGGYSVPALYPQQPLPLPGARPLFDVRPQAPTDDWRDGTVAPYTAGSAIMFEPELALAALRHYRSLDGSGGTVRLWHDDYGFRDSYNLDADGGPWVAPDRVSIDQGPLLIAIENARTGLIWNTFHRHPFVKDAMERLGLTRGDEE